MTQIVNIKECTMNLYEILSSDVVISNGTDKHTIHDYVDGFYEENLKKYQNIAKNVLEIGIYNGGSLALWKKYFTNANIFGVDINHDKIFPEFKNIEGITYYLENAYSEKFLNLIPNMDIIIDDGPHTLQSMEYVINNYSKKVNSKGIVIIEDIQEMSWITTLIKLVPSNFTVEIIDLRNKKSRYDDILFVMKRFD